MFYSGFDKLQVYCATVVRWVDLSKRVVTDGGNGHAFNSAEQQVVTADNAAQVQARDLSIGVHFQIVFAIDTDSPFFIFLHVCQKVVQDLSSYLPSTRHRCQRSVPALTCDITAVGSNYDRVAHKKQDICLDSRQSEPQCFVDHSGTGGSTDV